MVVKDIYKKLIIILLCCAAIYIILSLLLTRYSIFTASQNEYEEIKRDYEEIHQNFINKNQYEEKEIQLLQEKNELNIPNTLNQEDIIRIIHECCLNCGITIYKYNFSEVLEVSEVSDDEANREKDEFIISGLNMINVNLDFYSGYESLLNFIEALQNNGANMSITNLYFTIDDNNHSVKMDIKFYALNYKN
jgi:enoyl reductase-like protein